MLCRNPLVDANISENSLPPSRKEVTGALLLVFTAFIYIVFFKKMFNTVQVKPQNHPMA